MQPIHIGTNEIVPITVHHHDGTTSDVTVKTDEYAMFDVIINPNTAIPYGLVEPVTSEVGSTTWRELYPEGRNIFYEGDEPEKFGRKILAVFGFDPRADAKWGICYPPDSSDDEEYYSYQFHCPAEHLDAIYGSGRWPLGS